MSVDFTGVYVYENSGGCERGLWNSGVVTFIALMVCIMLYVLKSFLRWYLWYLVIVLYIYILWWPLILNTWTGYPLDDGALPDAVGREDGEDFVEYVGV